MARPEHPNPKHMRSKQEKRPRAQPIPRLLYYGGAALVLVLFVLAAYSLIPSKRPIDSASSTTSAQPPSEVRVGSLAPDLTFTTIDGTKRQLLRFRGHPVMLWLLATWCTSCQAGATALAQEVDQFQASGVQIIQLELYNNLGYPGPSMEEFVQRYVGPTASSPNWLSGEASQAGSYSYDPKGYPDIYFLIDKDGMIRTINGAPNVTMDQILAFARNVH